MLLMCTDSIEISKAPKEIKILPVGEVTTLKGDMLVDDESYRMIEAYFRSRRIDVVVDYEHQTLMGTQAPAAGWITSIRKGEDAIVASVNWTDKAKELIQAKEYRYLSPVVRVRNSDHRVTAVHSVALTNAPAIDGMPALVACLKDQQGGTDYSSILNDLCNMLSIPPDPDLETQIDNIKDAIKNLLNDNRTSLEENLKLQRSNKEKEIEEAVLSALKAGKITGGMKEAATRFAERDLEGFKEYINNTPAVVPMGKMDLSDHTVLKTSELSLTDKLIGLSNEDISKYR